MDFSSVEFTNYQESISEVLDAIGGAERLSAEDAILIKPNLINSSPHPITTSPDCTGAIVEYIQEHSEAKVVIAEGCGDSTLETHEVFEALGYSKLAREYGVELIDLNHEPLKKVVDERGRFFKEMYLPEIAFTHYIISVPVLKVHSLARVTGTLKNMMGFAPPSHYSGSYGSWKKALFHQEIQESIIDLNLHITPQLSIMDCSVGMAEFHLGGAHCSPPVGKIIAGYNPWRVDREACRLLGLDPSDIAHVAAGNVEKEDISVR